MHTELDEALVAACRRFLPSIVRLALSGGINGRLFVDLVKEAYVDVVTSDFGRDGRPTNIARSALITGLSRNDVKRIRARNGARDRTRVSDRKRYDLGKILREWHTNLSYVDSDGNPLALTIEGNAPSFAALARNTFSSDVPLSTILKEMISGGAITRLPDQRVRPLRDYFLPAPGNPEHAERLGGLLADFVSTVTHNLNRHSDDPSRIEIRTTQEEIAADHEAAFRRVLEKEATKFYQRIERWLQDKKEFETDDDDVTTRLGFGVYQISGNGAEKE